MSSRMPAGMKVLHALWNEALETWVASECNFTRWDRDGGAGEEFLSSQVTLLQTILPAMQVKQTACSAG